MRHFARTQLSAELPDGSIRLLSDRVDSRLLAGGRRTVVVNLARETRIWDPRYGTVELTREKFEQMVRNFDSNVYGQKIFLDVSHAPQNGAAAELKRLFIDGSKLRGEVEFTEYGLEAVNKRGMRYLSIDFHENYEDPETGKTHGALLLGAGLTIRPVVKRLEPIELSLDGGAHPVAVSQRIVQLFDEEKSQMNKFLQKLRDRLAAKKLSQAMIDQFAAQFEAGAKQLGDNEAALAALADALGTAGEQLAVQLAERGDDQAIKLDFSGLNLPAAGVSRDDVAKILAEAEAEREKGRKATAEKLEANRKLFTDAIAGAESLKALSEDQRVKLSEASELITADMTEEQVKKLAEHQIKVGSELAVASELRSLGYPGATGSTRIPVDDSNKVKQLQENVDKRLGISDRSDSQRYAGTGGQLLEVNKRFAEKVLAQYDAEHGARLHQEHKQLAGGDSTISDVDVPSIWERTVIREALYNLVGLQFVNLGTEQFATAINIPFSYRDTTAAGRGDTRTYEGQGIRRAGVIQDSEMAFPIPQKLAFEASDELRYLTSSRHLNWDAIGENQMNATRVIQEDLEQLIFNEILLAADEYGAVAVENEALTSQLDGTDNVFVLANFPVVRPRKVFDLKGSQIGNTQHPITVTYEGDPIEEFDGTGEQSAGDYYQIDYNLGEIRIVDETGALQTPANEDTLVVSYSYATNVAKFDVDLGEAKAEDHWDAFLHRYALRKAELRNNRYHNPNYGLMSGTVKADVEQAKKFAANYLVPGTSLEANGNLGRIKDIANFDTTAPALHMGDQRVIIGERGQTRLRMLKPWTLGELENQRDENGRFTGKKEAYGDQFIVLHTPTPLKRAATSIVLYSGNGRAARAE